MSSIASILVLSLEKKHPPDEVRLVEPCLTINKPSVRPFSQAADVHCRAGERPCRRLSHQKLSWAAADECGGLSRKHWPEKQQGRIKRGDLERLRLIWSHSETKRKTTVLMPRKSAIAIGAIAPASSTTAQQELQTCLKAQVQSKVQTDLLFRIG